MNKQTLKTVTRGILVLAGGLFMLNSATAAPGDLANQPLQTSASAPPNLMFMIDTSGSMNNVVPDAPYNPDTDYTPAGCDDTITKTTTTDTIYLNIVSAVPKMKIGSGSPLGIKDRCFDRTTNYFAKLNANRLNDDINNKNTTGYYKGQYTGNYLNWYFHYDSDNDETWTNQSMKPASGVDSRLHIAQVASTNLISGLSNMRIGLTTFNGSDGAYIQQNVKTLDDTHKAALTNSIDGLSGSGYTPVAETLLGIGRYFVGHSGANNPGGITTTVNPPETNGEYEGNLTLFPDSASPVTRDDDAVFNLYGVSGAAGDSNPEYASGLSSESPIQYWCQQNFAILLTDGRPAKDWGPASTNYTVSEVTDYDGDCAGASPACRTYDRKPIGATGANGGTYTYEGDEGSDYMDDVAKLLYDIDLRPDINDNDGNDVKNNIITYTIGFADDQVINDPLMYDTAVNGGGEFITAVNADDLAEAFNRATNSIIAQSSTSSAVTFNSSTLSSQSAVYQALFNTVRWSGELKSIPLDGFSGAVQTNCTAGTDNCWSAAEQLDNQSAGDRVILTYNKDNATATNWRGVPFNTANGFVYTSLDDTTVPQPLIDDLCAGPGSPPPTDCSTATGADLTANNEYIKDLINYLRGDRSDEGTGRNFRTRTHVLGDIVNASPVYVGKPASRWPDTAPFPVPSNPPGGDTDNSYSHWASGVSRTSVVYAAANDGMLHGFRTTESGNNGDAGNEVIAYVPTGTFATANNPGLHYLADPSYTHRFYNDLTPTIADVYMKHRTSSGTSSTQEWRTMLLGGMRSGGRSLYLLDVTNPGDFSEANARQLVEWEFTNPNLGYGFSRPVIAMMNDGRFAAILGNGYKSGEDGGGGDCSAKLFIVFLEGGLDGSFDVAVNGDGDYTNATDYMVINTGVGAAGNCNGLSTPAVVDLDGNGTADRVYAGDLFGNLWAFDLCVTPNNSTTCAVIDENNTAIPWKLADGTGLIMTAQDADGNAQPITVKPVVSRNPAEGAAGDDLIIVFGTGQYLTETDKSSTGVQTMYGVLDEGALTNGRGNNNWGLNPRANNSGFVTQTITEADCDVTGCSGKVRTITNTAMGNNEGWLIDFPPTSPAQAAIDNAGERIVSNPKIRNNTVFFNTVIPSNTVCSAGGSGWLMSVNLENGGVPLVEIFDLNNNGVIDVNDRDSNGNIPVGEKIQAIPAESTFLGDKQYTPDSTGTINVRDVNIGKTQREGRLSWREMIVD